MSKFTIILLILNFIIMKFVSVELAQIGLVIIFIKYFIDLGVFSRTFFSKGTFHKSEIFYLQFIGEYKNLHGEFRKISNFFNKYSLSNKDWNTFGFYYDDPKIVNPKKCRAVIGLQYENEDMKKEKPKLNQNIINWLQAEGLKHRVIQQSSCIIAKYPYVNVLSIIFAIKKFYTNLQKKLSDKDFLDKYNLVEKDHKFICTIEIYKKDTLEFCVPLENQEQFYLYENNNFK